MSYIHITKARATNFLQYRDIVLSLDDAGLVFLSGELSHDRSRSNSAGKTAALSVVPWVIWGKTLRDMRDASSVINYNESECEGEVEGLLDGAPFYIRRARSRTGNVVLVASFAGSSRMKDVQDEINLLFGTFDMAQNTVFLAQRKALEFLSSTDAERRKILEDLLKMRTWREAHDRVRDDMEWANDSIQKFNTEMMSAQSKIDKIILDKEHALEVAKTNLSARIEEAESLLVSYVESEASIRKQLEDIEPELRVALSSYTKAQADASAESRRVDGIRSKHVASSLALKKAESALTEARNGLCGSCRQPLPLPEDHISKLESARDEAEKEESGLRSLLEEGARAIKELSAIVAQEMKKYNEIAGKQNSFVYSLKSCSSEVESTKKKISNLRAEIGRVTATLSDDKEDELHTLYAIVKNRKSALEDLSMGVEAMKFWKEGFSLKGVPSMLVGESLPLLVQKTNEVLDVLSDGDLSLDILTLDAKRDGKSLMEKLTFVVGKEGREVYMEDCSAGEQRRIVISIFLALSRMQTVLTGQSWNIRMVDELFDELDPHGIERVMRVLKKMSESYTILVTSHRTELKDLDGFTSRLVARRSVGYSVLVNQEAS